MPLRSRGIDLSQILSIANTILAYEETSDLAQHHDTHIFPSASNINLIFTAGGVANVWSTWNRLVDSGGTTFHFSDHNVHISAVIFEIASVGTDIYAIQLCYGSSHVSITRIRFSSGGIAQLPPVHLLRIRSEYIPAGQRIYYRCMCTTAAASVNASLRYHFHD